MDAGVERVRDLVRSSHAVTVLTGAGISTDSGIPDFRGPDGVWTKNPGAERLFTFDNYVNDPEVRRLAWQNRIENPALHAEPNPGHRALVELERQDRLVALVTQNIDGLHQKAGSAPSRVIEIHGTVHEVGCLACRAHWPTPAVLDRVHAGEDDPACPECGGVLKTATISFGQLLVPDVLEAAVAAARECDLFLAVGTSLTVHPAAGLCDVALGNGARLVVLNAEPTPYDGSADAVLRTPISDTLPVLVG